MWALQALYFIVRTIRTCSHKHAQVGKRKEYHMSIQQYLFWADNMSAIAIVIFAAIVLAGLAIWIWAVDIHGSGAQYH